MFHLNNKKRKDIISLFTKKGIPEFNFFSKSTLILLCLFTDEIKISSRIYFHNLNIFDL